MQPHRVTARNAGARNPTDLLEWEFAQEKASALGRLGRALEAAIAALAAFDAGLSSGANRSGQERQARAALVADASTALWQLIVQREACGFRDTRYVLRDYRVPQEVAAGMGVMAPGKLSGKAARSGSGA